MSATYQATANISRAARDFTRADKDAAHAAIMLHIDSVTILDRVSVVKVAPSVLAVRATFLGQNPNEARRTITDAARAAAQSLGGAATVDAITVTERTR